MSNEFKPLREFGKFRLDVEKKFLWCNDQPVQLPLKAIELLCVLVEHKGMVVTKGEIWQKVWQDSFVEETNLTHNIYLLRKTFKDLGEPNLIQTVPRRGYCFASGVRDVVENGFGNDEVIFERRKFSQTSIEEISETQKQDNLRARVNQYKPNFELKGRYFFALPVPRLVTLAIIFVVLLTIASFWYFRGNSTTKNSIKTIAILPFQSLNKEEDDKAFGLGISESLTSSLGTVEQIVVRPSNSVKRIFEIETDPIEVGQKSKADAVIAGSFQRADGRIRVTIRLLNVADGSQIWAGAFDEKETDIFRLQDLLSAQVAKSLTDRLTLQERQQLASRQTEDFEAYKSYLRGRHAWNKRTPEGFWESIRLFQAAIDRDATFALAYAGLADAYVLLSEYNALAPNKSYPKAKAAAQKALDIDPNLVEARTTLAYIQANYEWNYLEAEREYRRVIEINPNYATAHQWYGELLYTTKRFAEGEMELRRAAELDPLAPVILSEMMVLKYYERKFDEAITLGAKIKQEFPNFPTIYLFTSWAYEQKQMPEEAFANEFVFWKLQGVSEETLAEMERAVRQEGYTIYLREIAEMLEKAAESRQLFHDYRLVHIYARLREREKTLEWLEKAIKNHSATLNRVNLDPNFDFLRDDEQFQTLQRKLQKYQ